MSVRGDVETGKATESSDILNICIYFIRILQCVLAEMASLFELVRHAVVSSRLFTQEMNEMSGHDLWAVNFRHILVQKRKTIETSQ